MDRLRRQRDAGTYLDTTPGAELMHTRPRSPEGVIAADASSLLLRQSDVLEGENDRRSGRLDNSAATVPATKNVAARASRGTTVWMSVICGFATHVLTFCNFGFVITAALGYRPLCVSVSADLNNLMNAPSVSGGCGFKKLKCS